MLTLVCADRPGIVHAVTAAIVASAGNVIELQQFSSRDTGRFFLRLEVDTPVTRGALLAELNPVAERFDAEIRLEDATRAIRTLVLGSKAEHCANDLLFRQRAGHLPIEVTRILANHPTLGDLAGFYDVPFEHLPIAGPEDKAAFEDRVRRIIEEEGIELVVLARYMQIVSPELCAELEGRAINIHHSFLPGFKGGRPYQQAYERGVKLIGATAHYVTADLDEGPIIEQEILRVNHAADPRTLATLGQDAEALALSRAVRWHCEHRILIRGRRTVVFT